MLSENPLDLQRIRSNLKALRKQRKQQKKVAGADSASLLSPDQDAAYADLSTDRKETRDSLLVESSMFTRRASKERTRV